MWAVRPGEIVAGKYRVERVLGAGGMGVVVEARHLALDGLVAIKLLARGSVDETSSARFRREARAVAQLRSPHVVKVFDAGVHDGGIPYLVMEHLEGRDLAEVSRELGPLPVSTACGYLVEACEGLAEAHARGIVHRDVKLSNLFLASTPGGREIVKVLDFGVSKTSSGDTAVTSTSVAVGSLRYMSPEQMHDSSDVDARADIWSAGVVLYRLLAGRPPFEGDTLGQLCTRVLLEPPPPLRASRPDVAPGLEAVVLRCLAKDRAARFQDVAELAAALAPFTDDPVAAGEAARRMAGVLGHAPSSVLPPPVSTASRSSLAGAWVQAPAQAARPRAPLALAVALAVAAGALVGGVALRPRAAPASVERRSPPEAPLPGEPPPQPTAAAPSSHSVPVPTASATLAREEAPPRRPAPARPRRRGTRAPSPLGLPGDRR